MSKGLMTADDLVITDMQGKRLAGKRQPSSELGMHILIYCRRPDVHAVCHAHPPIATGYAAAGIPLNKAIVSEVVLSLGCIPVAPYATPGTPELTEALDPLVQHYDALLMANHGVVTYGPDLLTAFFRMETVVNILHRFRWSRSYSGNKPCFLAAMWKNCSRRACVTVPRRRHR